MAKKVCDFCLSEGKGIFKQPEKLSDGHYICKSCRNKIRSYDLPIKYDLFQCLVTAQKNMVGMIMGTYLESHKPDDCIAKFYPFPQMMLHNGEHCVNLVKATLTVEQDAVPECFATRSIVDVCRKTIHNIPDAKDTRNITKIEGQLIETEAALYFMSEHIVNCHRLCYVKRKNTDSKHVIVETPTKQFTYSVEHADLFFLRERFFDKVIAAKNNKTENLIYIQNDNEVRITPGVYDIPHSLRPGIYEVKAINNAGLHVRDSYGRMHDYTSPQCTLNLSSGGTLECTGEYELKWLGNKTKDEH